MAVPLSQESVWFDKYKFEDAERQFCENQNKLRGTKTANKFIIPKKDPQDTDNINKCKEEKIGEDNKEEKPGLKEEEKKDTEKEGDGKKSKKSKKSKNKNKNNQQPPLGTQAQDLVGTEVGSVAPQASEEGGEKAEPKKKNQPRKSPQPEDVKAKKDTKKAGTPTEEAKTGQPNEQKKSKPDQKKKKKGRQLQKEMPAADPKTTDILSEVQVTLDPPNCPFLLDSNLKQQSDFQVIGFPSEQSVVSKEQASAPKKQPSPPKGAPTPSQEQAAPPKGRPTPPKEQVSPAQMPPKEQANAKGQPMPPKEQAPPPQGQPMPPKEQAAPKGQPKPSKDQPSPPKGQPTPTTEQAVHPPAQQTPSQEQPLPPKEPTAPQGQAILSKGLMASLPEQPTPPKVDSSVAKEQVVPTKEQPCLPKAEVASAPNKAPSKTEEPSVGKGKPLKEKTAGPEQSSLPNENAKKAAETCKPSKKKEEKALKDNELFPDIFLDDDETPLDLPKAASKPSSVTLLLEKETVQNNQNKLETQKKIAPDAAPVEGKAIKSAEPKKEEKMEGKKKKEGKKGCKGSSSAKSSLADEIARARQHIKNSLQCDAVLLNAGDGSDLHLQMKKLEQENTELKTVTKELQKLVSELQVRVSALERSQKTPVASKMETKAPTKADKAKAEDNDAVDLFGSDEEDEDKERIRQERLKMYQEKISKKPTLIAKSNLIFDVKPWDDETDMKEMERQVRRVGCDGLLWGASKLVPLAYGIHKLQISCVVEDEKVSIDWLQEEIEKIEDLVQSVDIAAFNKV